MSDASKSMAVVGIGNNLLTDDGAGIHALRELALENADEDLACIYSGATAFVYPSLYEGFGLPVLEAMACETPVICSNAASLPEVAGDAAVLTDPQDIEEMAKGIDRLVKDRDFRLSVIEKGRIHVRRFSWTKTALKTYEVFRRYLTE